LLEQKGPPDFKKRSRDPLDRPNSGSGYELLFSPSLKIDGNHIAVFAEKNFQHDSFFRQGVSFISLYL